MSWSARAIVRALACLACTCQGLYISEEKLPPNSYKEPRGSWKGLAMLLMASNPLGNLDTKLLIEKARVPVCIGAGCAIVAVGAHQLAAEMEQRKEQLHQLKDEVDVELKALRKLTQSRRVEPPAPESQLLLFRICSERKVLEELQVRKTMLEDDVLPKLTQLYGKSNLKQALKLGTKPVSQRTSDELAELNNTLAARIDASCLVYDEYESIGQTPPDNLNAWPLAKLQGLLDDLTSKRAELREVVRLYGQLRRRMERSVMEWSADRLTEHVAELTDQLEEEHKRTEKLNLLSEVEALMMERGNEMALNSLRSLSVPELRELQAKMQGKDQGTAAGVSPAEES